MLNKILPLTTLLLAACCPAEDSITLKDFVELIPKWEVYEDSPHTVVGDNGAAYGHYQIHKVMVDDYNRITGKNARHVDAFNPAFSKHLAYEVLSHYAKHIESKGITPNASHLLFIWNGGGSAWKRVENPKADQKQINLDRYRAKALPIINNFRSQTSEVTMRPTEVDNLEANLVTKNT